MSKVFVIYNRQDRSFAEQLVRALQGAGVPVVWDQDILPGDKWQPWIFARIDEAACVLAVWSSLSINDEGDFHNSAGSDRSFFEKEHERAGIGKIIGIIRESCTPPFMYTDVQHTDLSEWSAWDESHAEYRKLLEAIRLRLEGRKEPQPSASASSFVRQRSSSADLNAATIRFASTIQKILEVEVSRRKATERENIELTRENTYLRQRVRTLEGRHKSLVASVRDLTSYLNRERVTPMPAAASTPVDMKTAAENAAEDRVLSGEAAKDFPETPPPRPPSGPANRKPPSS